MKNLRQLGLILSVGTFAALVITGCSDDATPTGGTAGSSGTGTSGSGTSGGSGGSGTGGGGSSSGGSKATGGGGAATGGGGAATGGGGAATGGGGAATGGGGGATGGGAGGAAGGSGGSGGAGGAGADLKCTKAGDPGENETCTTYCNNYDTTCKANIGTWMNTKYADKAACMTDCMNNFGKTGADIQDAICCRGYHVKNAAGSQANKEQHCPHAAGIMLCK